MCSCDLNLNLNLNLNQHSTSRLAPIPVSSKFSRRTTEGDRANRESAAGRNAREHGRCLREPRYRVGLARSLHNPPEPKRDNGPQVGGVRQLWVPCGRCGARITVSSKRCDPPPVLAPDGPRMAHTRAGLTFRRMWRPTRSSPCSSSWPHCRLLAVKRYARHRTSRSWLRGAPSRRAP